MNDDRLTTLEGKVAHLDSAVTRLVTKMENHLDEKREMEKTLRNIDDNVRGLTIQIAASAGDRHKETEGLLHPLWEVVRKHDGRFHECGSSIMKKTEEAIEEKDRKLRRDARSHLLLIWFGVTALVSLAIYSYNMDIKNIKDDIYHIIDHIDNHHTKNKVNDKNG